MKPLVLVTGGAGFIGSHLVESLLERGYRVRVYDKLVEQVHGDDPSPRYVPADAEFVRGDMRDADALRRALDGVEAIFHDAAEVGVGQSMYEIVRYVDANTGGTAVLLELLANERHTVEKIVVASSMSIYGEGAYRCARHGQVHPRLRPPEQFDRGEWDTLCPDCGRRLDALPTSEAKTPLPTSIYAITKLDQELMCLAYGESYGVPVTALRYFNAYGPRQALSNPYTGVAAIFSSRLLNARPPVVFEDGLQQRDFVHVSDLVRANVLALEASAANGRVINVGTGVPTSVLEVARILAAELDVDVEPEVVGQFRAGDIRHCYADISVAQDVLEYTPRVAFEDGMAELVQWLATQEAEDRVDPAREELRRRGLTR
jgi:dTDP-L-rhamnose 4-epimerase